MRYLVTGGAGFIGSHLCRRLVADGEDVVALDDLSAGNVENLAGVPDVRLVEADIRDAEAVADASRGCDVILHHAAMRSVPLSVAEPARTTDVNVLGTLHILLAARAAGARVVFASSSSVYGDRATFPLSEEMAPLPRSPYAASKLAGEGYCRAWWHAFGVQTISLRYFNVYGPRQDPASRYAAVIPLFILACLGGDPAEIHGDGEQARDFTFIADVVDANIAASRAGEEAGGAVVNIGGGRTPTSINRLLELIAERVGTRPEATHTAPREGDIRRSHADVSLAERLLDYRPRYTIERGLDETTAWFSDRHSPGTR
jgi:nucleoside-diphosphate-sugar epimerase